MNLRRKILLQFYPELELRLVDIPMSCYRQAVMTHQSRDSFKMYAQARSFKRKTDHNFKHNSDGKFRPKIMVLKKYSNYKGVQRGKKFRSRTLPSLVLGGRSLCQGKVPLKKVFNEVGSELVNISK